jgi:P-type E1-E2 ATPase
VVGDVIKITSGMNIPVDGILFATEGNIKSNEAAMTGESDDLDKDTMEKCKEKQEEKDAEYGFQKNPQRSSHDIPSPVLLSGTVITIGKGYFLCIMVGKNSCVGKIMDKL